MTYLVPHYIGGKRLEESGNTLPIYDPAKGLAVGKIAIASTNTVDLAVQTAKRAWQQWATTPAVKRARCLFRLKELLESEIDVLAKMVTEEHGKTLSDARASIQRGIDVIEFACNIPSHLKGSYSEEVASDVDCYSFRQSLGVCVGITPFNFPAMIPLWMFPISIACGNTFVLKPSEKDPSCPLHIVELCQKAGIPDGVVNVVQGDKDTVEALITHEDVKAVSFVGSTAVAEYVQRTAIQHHKRVQAFGGAKNHGVVAEDANLDQVSEAIIGAAFGSAGERCMAISVVVAVTDKVADELIERLIPRIKQIKIGTGKDPETEMGPLVTAEHKHRVSSYIDLGVQEGATLLVDGRGYKPQGAAEHGFFMGGTLFDHVNTDMRIYQEEIFGPVLCIVRVPDLETAIQLVSDHPYGNGTAIFTQSGITARQFVSRVEVGMVGVNVPIPVPVASHSFGGWKRSIFADMHMHGMEGVQFYTHLKAVTQRFASSDQIRTQASTNHFILPSVK